MLAAEPTPIECVEGCGDPVALVVAVIGLIVALAAAWYARVAASTAIEQRDMQRVEHDAFMQQMNARAILDCEMHLVANDDRRQKAHARVDHTVLAIGMHNDGTKAAERVAVSVMAPMRRVGLRWASTEHGGELPGHHGQAQMTDETLETPDGEVPALYIDRVVGPVDLSTGGFMLYVRLDFEVGETRALDPSNHPPTELHVPVRVKISSDDLPEGRQSITLDRIWTFWRAPQPAP